MAIAERHLKALRPYIVGDHAVERGDDEDRHLEFDMYCPLHEDTRRSAGIRLDTGAFKCHGCGEGLSLAQLMVRRAGWVDPPASTNGHGKVNFKAKEGPTEQVTDAMIAGWQSNLQDREDALDALQLKRHLHRDTLIKYEIGFDNGRNCYTIPVRDSDNAILNVRRYIFDPPAGRRKMWSINGMGSPRLYPLAILAEDPEEIVVCEGEWDALLTIQNGFPAITRTGAAKVWKSSWSAQFKDKVVYLCHDADKAGQTANRAVGRALAHVAKSVKVINLPYEITTKDGKDLSDFWGEFRKGDFKKLLQQAIPFDADDDDRSDDPPKDANVIDAFDAEMSGRPLRFNVTIKGRREPGYQIPKRIRYSCTQDAGSKCNTCPLNAVHGEDEVTLSPNDPVVLEMIEADKRSLSKIMRHIYGGIPQCDKLIVEDLDKQGVEILLARPSIDTANGTHAGDYKTIKITSVGRHDTMPNNTVQVVGAPHPNPKTQANEFLAWGVNRLQTSIDLYEPNKATLAALRRFQPRKGQTPLAKLAEISKEMASHVTRIYGRAEMHAAMDLVFHSPMSFRFGDQFVGRGWLELLVVGDTRTGKSEAAARLCEHYGAGEVVSCESATFAGIVGGAQQIGNKEWMITWGAIPINDRRLVVLDEISGLQPYEIAQMSSVRSSGVAELTKIAQERTHARTRLIWLGNPRDAKMGDFTYGVQAIKPLVGNPEDIARFDLAMSVQSEDIPSDIINSERSVGRQRYSSELCHHLVRWVWSRSPEQVKFSKASRDRILREAQRMGARYIDDPPLVQAANVRIKIARVAAALAGRLFSTDAAGECIMVHTEHVRDAVAFIDKLYGMPGFGYAEISGEAIRDRQTAAKAGDEIAAYIRSRKGLSKFLRTNPEFRSQDIEAAMNMDKSEVNALVNKLWEARMLRVSRNTIKVEPGLQAVLRRL